MDNIVESTFRELNTLTYDLAASTTTDVLFSALPSAPSSPPNVSLFKSDGSLLGFNYSVSSDRITITNPTTSIVSNAQIRIL